MKEMCITAGPFTVALIALKNFLSHYGTLSLVFDVLRKTLKTAFQYSRSCNN